MMAAGLGTALIVSATVDRRAVHSPLLQVFAIAVALAGVIGVTREQSDPMSLRAAWVTAATGPLACALTCLAIPGPLAEPNQLNALGCGVAVCAFMCVRGRTAAAWTAFAAMVAVVTTWSVDSGQGLYGLWISLPNAAVVGMATLFAVVVRPAADTIRRLNQESIHQAATMAAANARLAERDARRAELRRFAWPFLRRIAAAQRLSAEEIAEVRLAEAQLRDSVRARSLNRPQVIDAVRSARSRGVDVVMFDDGALDSADAVSHDEYCQLAVECLRVANDGSVTLRIHPPGRPVAASIVTERDGGSSMRVDLDAAGRLIES